MKELLKPRYILLFTLLISSFVLRYNPSDENVFGWTFVIFGIGAFVAIKELQASDKMNDGKKIIIWSLIFPFIYLIN